jgi:hypothetical protein
LLSQALCRRIILATLAKQRYIAVQRASMDKGSAWRVAFLLPIVGTG